MTDLIPDVVRMILLPEEWRAAVLILGFIFVATEAVKRIWRLAVKSYKRADVWLIAIGIGIAGAWYIWPPSSTVPFWYAGSIIGGISSFMHKYFMILIRWRVPGLAFIITGERRRNGDINETGKERRNSKK